MSDQWPGNGPVLPGPEDELARLRAAAPPAPFAPAEAVRRRGRQRAHRQAVSVGAAVLVVVGLGAGGTMAGLDSLSSPLPPAAAPGTSHESPSVEPPEGRSPPPERAPTDVSDRWFLAPEQLGPGEWTTGFEPERFESDPPWLWGSLCPEYQVEEHPSLRMRRDLQAVAWTDGPWPGEVAEMRWVDQVVELFDPGAAEANLDEVRAAVVACERYGVAATGFAGQESLLVAEQVGEGQTLTAVVRVGDVVTTLRAHDPELGRGDAETLRELAGRAADRLP